MAEWEGGQPMKWRTNRKHVPCVAGESIKEKIFGGIII